MNNKETNYKDTKSRTIANYRPFIFLLISLVISFPLTRIRIINIAFILFFSSIVSLIDLTIINKKKNYWIIILIFDILISSFLIYMSGGVESSLYMLNFLLILIYTMRNGKKAAWIATLVSIITYGILLYLQWKGIILISEVGKINFYGFDEKNLSSGFYIYQFFFSSIASLIIASLSTWMEDRNLRKIEQLEYVRYTTDDILKAMEEGVITIDNKDEIVFVNTSFAFFSGLNILKKGQKIPSTVKDLINIDQSEINLIGTDGNKRIFSCVSNQLTDFSGEKIGAFLVLHNLTEIREKEKRINEMNQITLMAEMSAGIAHEIRNPLASIRASVEILFKDIKGEKKEIADIVKSEVDRINKLVEEFLNYSKIPIPILKRNNLTDIIEDTIKRFVLSENNKELNFIKEFKNKRFYTNVDKDQMIQVLINLFENARNAMKNSERKNIKICLYEDINNIYIDISDTGHGINSTVINRIFNPFFSGNSRSTGLGLSIVKKLIKYNNGDIRVESEERKRTKFTITLPKENNE